MLYQLKMCNKSYDVFLLLVIYYRLLLSFNNIYKILFYLQYIKNIDLLIINTKTSVQPTLYSKREIDLF